MLNDPVWVYDNWSAYAEGAPGFEDTRLTEQLAMTQLRHLIRLKRLGVRFDYYLMNACWFAPDGAYRQWRKPDWPNGPDRWIAGCVENGIKPGMWFGCNTLWQIDPAPQWRDSLAEAPAMEGWGLSVVSFHEGGFLQDFMDALQYHYQRGIRLFEFDFANFDAATSATVQTCSPAEIRRRNEQAFREALKAFRRKNRDAMLVAFNGFGGDFESTAKPLRFAKPVDLRWLEVFDTLYSGDTRASDVPQASFWRSVDLYNDHMVRGYEQNGLPLERIDPFFTLSTTWFGSHRGKNAWRGALLLTAARGSWKQTIYGSLELLDDDDAHWFAKVQRMYAPLLALGRTKTFGGLPGEGQAYGFAALCEHGALYTVVNPLQRVQKIDLPVLSVAQVPLTGGRVLFRDAGFIPVLREASIELGPGQMAVIGFGQYATTEYDLGVQDDVIIPRRIESAPAAFRSVGANVIEATVIAPPAGDLRIFFEQRAADGTVFKGKTAGTIEAWQEDRKVPVEAAIKGDIGFGGVSWSAAEIRQRDFAGGSPLALRYSLEADTPIALHGRVYIVEY